jgi:hypothetical protein
VAGSRSVRTILTVIMDVLVVAAIALTVRVGVMFLGQVASLGWGKAVVALTSPLVIPFGVEAIKTPYGGAFDANAAMTVVAVLIAEFLLSMVRSRG